MVQFQFDGDHQRWFYHHCQPAARSLVLLGLLTPSLSPRRDRATFRAAGPSA
jgi:hypothetical protein